MAANPQIDRCPPAVESSHLCLPKIKGEMKTKKYQLGEDRSMTLFFSSTIHLPFFLPKSFSDTRQSGPGVIFTLGFKQGH